MTKFEKMKNALESAEQFLKKSESIMGKLVWAKVSTVLHDITKDDVKTVVIEGREYILDEAVFNLILNISTERDNLFKQLNGSISKLPTHAKRWDGL